MLRGASSPPMASTAIQIIQSSRFRVQGSRFRVQGSGFKVQGSGFKVQGSGFKVQGSGFKVQGSGFRVQGSGFRVQGSGFGTEIWEFDMETILEAIARDTFGKNEARRTRREGKVPGVLYGGDGNAKGATPISVEPKALLKILHSESGANTLISLKLDGGASKVLVKEYQ